VNIVSVLLITSESLFRFDVSPALAGIVRRESIPGPIKRSNPEYQRLYRLRGASLKENVDALLVSERKASPPLRVDEGQIEHEIPK
jgi:hypothetical protein